MVLELKIRKVGNSAGVILPKQILAHLKVAEGDKVDIKVRADGSLRIRRQKAGAARQLAVAKGVLKRYRNTLKKLAK